MTISKERMKYNYSFCLNRWLSGARLKSEECYKQQTVNEKKLCQNFSFRSNKINQMGWNCLPFCTLRVNVQPNVETSCFCRYLQLKDLIRLFRLCEGTLRKNSGLPVENSFVHLVTFCMNTKRWKES